MTPPQAPFSKRWHARIAASRFLTFSLLLHVIIVVVGGSVVLFRHVDDPPDFETPSGEGLVTSSSADPAPPPPPAEQMERVPTSAPQLASLKIPTIVADSQAPSAFTLPATAPQISGTSLIGKTIERAIGNGATRGLDSGSMGGTMVFGSRERPKANGSLVGYLYDLKQTRDHKPTNMDPAKYGVELTKFCQHSWDGALLNEYFKAPKPLYLTQVFIPDMIADAAPKAFDVDKGPHKIEPKMWAAIYKGKVIAPFTGQFRFVGFADDVLEVRFEGKHVLSAGCHMLGGPAPDKKYVYDFLDPDRQSWYAGMGDRVSAPISVEKGRPYDIEVMIGEEPGGFFCAHLLWEQEGVVYEKDKKNNPILPIFQLAAAAPADPTHLPPFENDGQAALWKATGAESSALDGMKPPGM